MDSNIEQDIKTLKKMIREFFVIKPHCYSEEEILNNQRATIDLIRQLGYGGIDKTLLKNILNGKEDENLRRRYYRSKKKKTPSLNVDPRYYEYFKKLNPIQIKELISSYFIYAKVPSFPKEDLMRRRHAIVLLLQKLGYPSSNISDEFLKEYLNGKYDHLPSLNLVKPKIKEQNLIRLKTAYNHRKENWEEFESAFQEYFSPYIDVYSVKEGEMEELVREQLKIRKDEENVLR